MKLKQISLIALLIFAVTAVTTHNSAAAATDYLDYGFYWFNSSNGKTKAYNTSTGQANSVSSSYYNSSKPTVLYFHGWQKGTSERNYWRESFQFTDNNEGISVKTCTAWKNAGWNVAIFYWNQFADENEVKDAEAKIWTKNGPRGMRYRLSDGSYKTTKSPSKSVTDLAYDQLLKIISNNTSGTLRFVGHSLGNQLAVNLANKVNTSNVNSKYMPERVELIDPFWSKNSKSYLGGDWTGERVRAYVSDMIQDHDVAVSWYHTSGILDLWVGDANNSLKSLVAYFKPKFWYLSSWQITEKHTYAPNMYFWTKSYSAPDVTNTSNDGPSASTPTWRIKQMMGSQYKWEQVEGRYTPNPSDDKYKRYNY